MKDYEIRETGRRFLPGVPVVARLDGRSFSKFTKGMERPYDSDFTWAMTETARELVGRTNARIAYTQSDEISLVFLADRPGAEIFFDGKVQKMTSVLAAMATSAFTMRALRKWPERVSRMLPHFDARVFQVPNRTETANCLLWREFDATKNAVSMAARAHFSHKRVAGLSTDEMQELLWREASVNFDRFPPSFKRGAYLRRETFERELSADELAAIPEAARPSGPVRRSAVEVLDMPIFSKVANREAVIFDRQQPALIGPSETSGT